MLWLFLNRHLQAGMAREARSLLPRYAVQVEGLSRPHGGWRDYEIWRRCGLGGFRPGKNKGERADENNDNSGVDKLRVSLLPPPPPELAETCAVLRGVAAGSGALVHSAMFSAIAPGTRLEPHCGPNNGRLVLHVGLSTPYVSTKITPQRPHGTFTATNVDSPPAHCPCQPTSTPCLTHGTWSRAKSGWCSLHAGAPMVRVPGQPNQEKSPQKNKNKVVC